MFKIWREKRNDEAESTFVLCLIFFVCLIWMPENEFFIITSLGAVMNFFQAPVFESFTVIYLVDT